MVHAQDKKKKKKDKKKRSRGSSKCAPRLIEQIVPIMTLGAVEHFLTYGPFKHGVLVACVFSCQFLTLETLQRTAQLTQPLLGGCWRGNGCKLHDPGSFSTPRPISMV